jgi:hypothetical protein
MSSPYLAPSGQSAPAGSSEFGATTVSGTALGAAGSRPAVAPDAATSAVPHVANPGNPITPPPPPGAGPTPGNRPGRMTRNRGPRRAQLQLRHINPWTALKFSCVLAIALFFVWLIVIGILYVVLDAAGAIGSINNSITTIQGGNAKDPITPGIVFGGAAIIGVVNVVLFIALSTIGSVVYNLCADLVGGVEITLSER